MIWKRLDFSRPDFPLAICDKDMKGREKVLALTTARLMYSRTSDLPDCSRLSMMSVNGDADSFWFRSFEMRSRLCVRRCCRFIGAMLGSEVCLDRSFQTHAILMSSCFSRYLLASMTSHNVDAVGAFYYVQVMMLKSGDVRWIMVEFRYGGAACSNVVW